MKRKRYRAEIFVRVAMATKPVMYPKSATEKIGVLYNRGICKS